jgi:hypothetical protein
MVTITRDVKDNEYPREKEDFEFRTHNVSAGSAGIVRHKYTIVTITISSIRKRSGKSSLIYDVSVYSIFTHPTGQFTSSRSSTCSDVKAGELATSVQSAFFMLHFDRDIVKQSPDEQSNRLEGAEEVAGVMLEAQAEDLCRVKPPCADASTLNVM